MAPRHSKHQLFPTWRPAKHENAWIRKKYFYVTSSLVDYVNKRLLHHVGSSTLLLFIFWGALPKIEKNVKICLNTFSRNYLCQKIVKGGWQSWIFRDPLNSTKFGCFTKITCRSPIVKVIIPIFQIFMNFWQIWKKS